MQKTDWNDFSEKERLSTFNTVLLTGLLYKMCQVQLVLQSKDEGDLNMINSEDVEKSMDDAEKLLNEIKL